MLNSAQRATGPAAPGYRSLSTPSQYIVVNKPDHSIVDKSGWDVAT
jgi:hypothetical protein